MIAIHDGDLAQARSLIENELKLTVETYRVDIFVILKVWVLAASGEFDSAVEVINSVDLGALPNTLAFPLMLLRVGELLSPHSPQTAATILEAAQLRHQTAERATYVERCSQLLASLG